MTPVKPFRFMPFIKTERRLLASILVMLMCSVVWPVCVSFMAFIFNRLPDSVAVQNASAMLSIVCTLLWIFSVQSAYNVFVQTHR
jgi:ABC-type bacteriocin/lantibiotic exporter with double-glycine peptidase domain